MSIQRWDPFAEMMSLRDAMNRLMEDSFVRPGAAMTASGGSMLGAAVDLREQDDAYVLEASLPGLKPEDIDVSVLGNQITIQGELKGEQEREQGRYHLRERRFGRFQRTIALPSAVQANQAQCDFNNGVLKVTLPKAEETRPRRIPIGAGRQPAIESAGRTTGGQVHQQGTPPTGEQTPPQ
jgi:HSP20 family protein